ncbi:MAG: alkaline phytoceramidase, partial [Nitrospira sp.]|nr:alkaline phytoceramidase [Nitrospira sp.]
MSRAEVWRHTVLVLAAAIAGIVILGGSPSPQDPAYHRMADERHFFGIPNCLNVLSNLPFAFVGLLGLVTVFRLKTGKAPLFGDPWERWPYAVLFAGIGLTTVGSAYYHLSPDNTRLVWDRLPMTFGFMGLLTAILTERVGLRTGRLLLGPLLLLGVGSVVYWY